VAEIKRYVNKKQSLFNLIDKIKLWPARSGILHGIKTLEKTGNRIHITTHCGEDFLVWDSKNSRSARWLRNRWCSLPCPKCKIPPWKTEKYAQTVFTDAPERKKG
jgi:pyrrolysyl-tRNA synthetase-like protein